MRNFLLSTALAFPLPLAAQDVALLLGNERYEQQSRVRRADEIVEAEERLAALGFTVGARVNGRIDAARDLASAFQGDAADADRLVVALSGHFVTDGTRSWFLTSEANAPTLFTVDTMGLSVESLMQVLAARPGHAVLVLGEADTDAVPLTGGTLRGGLGQLDVPQGVTVLTASPSAAARALSGVLTEPDAVIGGRILSDQTLKVQGFLPENWAPMPAEVIVETAPDTASLSDAVLNAEAEQWDAATSADAVEAYRRYIALYPRGRFVAEAEAQIAEILSEPNRAARLAEERLALTRTARRDIQADLTLLGYNTRGVDGIFGSGTRGAVTNWQQSNGFPQTSYLTRDQINQLDAQAARRQSEIEAEQARAQAEAEARDRAYWAETGARGDEAGYRAYLERYPEGVFANIASTRIGTIEDQRRSEAQAADRAAWSIAETRDTVEGYQDYLAAYPDGDFAPRAQARINDLSGPSLSEDQIERALQDEESLRLSGVRAQLLELRLRELGFDPGRLDGVVDEATRDAIAAYQESNGLPPTGYVDRVTAVGLMTGSLNLDLLGR